MESLQTREVTKLLPYPSDLEISLAGLSAYINAGGRGTRMNSLFTPDKHLGITKALLRLSDSKDTLLEHHVNELLDEHADSIVVGVGDHMNALELLEEKYANTPSVHGVYYANQLGNGGDLIRAVRDFPELFSANIYIANVDTFIDVNKEAVKQFHESHDAELTFIMTTRGGVPNYQAFYMDKDDNILHSDEDARSIPPVNLERQTAYRASSTGGMIISRSALERINWIPEQGELGLYRDIVGTVIAQGNAFAFNNSVRGFIDVGTVETWRKVNDPVFTLTDNQEVLL